MRNTGIAKFLGIVEYVDLYRLKRYVKNVHKTEAVRENKQKVFVIGLNKTGTTTLKVVLDEFGYKVATQKVFELLSKDIFEDKGHGRIISYCKYYDAFQDLPFSIPGTYKYLDEAFPGSKFILTVRDSDDQWFRSMKNYYGGSANVVKKADEKSEIVFRWYSYKRF